MAVIGGENDHLMDWPRLLRQIEDSLCPSLKLDSWEKSLYYYLLRLTHVDGRDSTSVAVVPLGEATGMSEFKARECLRSLHSKKCISIEERSRTGHLVRVFLPDSIEGVLPDERAAQAIDVERIDFFTERLYLQALLKRQEHRCFYTLRIVTAETAVLDHVVARMSGGDNGYRNVVVACHDVNALKQGQAPEDFIRKLYRDGILNFAEMENRLRALEELQSGKLVPDVGQSK